MAGRSTTRYPAELRERAVRMVADVRAEHDSEWAAMGRVAELLGVGTAETVRKWCRQAQIDDGERARGHDRGVGGGEAAQAGERRAQAGERDLEGGVGFLRGRARPAIPLIVAFIDAHVGEHPEGLRWGVETICAQLTELGAKIAPATYYEHRGAQPSRRA